MNGIRNLARGMVVQSTHELRFVVEEKRGTVHVVMMWVARVGVFEALDVRDVRMVLVVRTEPVETAFV